MTPLLVRLRAADRRTTLVSPSDAADALTAVADRLVNGQQVLELVQGEQPDLDDETGAHPAVGAHTTSAQESVGDAKDSGEYRQFRVLVTERFSTAASPLNLASLAHEIRRELGQSIDDTGWFGFGSFARALESLTLPEMRLSQHMVWDGGRHETPELGSSGHGFTLPEPVTRLTALLNLPRLPQDAWPQVYRALADYAGSHHFNLAEATRWSRDRLAERGTDVSRAAVGFVSRGASFGGAPLYRQPPPTADEIGNAFGANVLSRAEAAAIVLSKDETKVVRDWLGTPQASPQTGV